MGGRDWTMQSSSPLLKGTDFIHDSVDSEEFQKTSEGRGERQLGGDPQIHWRQLNCLREPEIELKEVLLGSRSEQISNTDLRKKPEFGWISTQSNSHPRALLRTENPAGKSGG